MDNDTIIHFGKYKGQLMSEVFKVDKSYVRWLANSCDNFEIKVSASFILGDFTVNKIEEIIKDCIISRGYSESEAMMFIRTLKNS